MLVTTTKKSSYGDIPEHDDQDNNCRDEADDDQDEPEDFLLNGSKFMPGLISQSSNPSKDCVIACCDTDAGSCASHTVGALKCNAMRLEVVVIGGFSHSIDRFRFT